MDNENPIFRSLALIEEGISEKLTVENIANAVYFSRFHYQRLFREIVGDSVMEYVAKRRLTLAGRALLETGAAIIDIALAYGYDSREGFTRSFKAYMGVSPTEYRRYGLTAISQKTVKERLTMTYSKNTDEMIRELNGFIAKAGETAARARKQKELPEYIPFWNMLADTADGLADKTAEVLEHIASIAEHPDEITKRFLIMKAVEDIGFQSNLMAFNAGLTASRDTPERTGLQWPICEKYLELARAASLKTEKIAIFFRELSALIFADMRKAAAEKMNRVVQNGKAAVDAIDGYSYIKEEALHLVKGLSVPIEEVTESLLRDCLFKLNIILFAADTDVFRDPEAEAMFEGLRKFKESLSEAAEFFPALQEAAPTAERNTAKRFQDIAYQGNILLFYTRGEVSHEKLGRSLSAAQKAAFDAICQKISGFIRFAHGAADAAAFKPVAEKLYSIHADLMAEAEKYNERGGAIRFIAAEFKGLADAVTRCAKE